MFDPLFFFALITTTPLSGTEATSPLVIPHATVHVPASAVTATQTTVSPAAVTNGGFDEPLPSILEALNPATGNTQRSAALQRLANRRDIRLVPLFEALLNDPNLMLERSAVSALGLVTDATATHALARVAATWPSVVAELAFTALGRQQTETAAAALDTLQKRSNIETWRRQSATQTLRNRYAQYAGLYPPVSQVESSGLWLAVLASGEVAAIDMLAIGTLGPNPSFSAPLGFLSGAAIGLGGGYLIGKGESISTVQGYRFVSYENWGLVAGITLSNAALNDAPPRTNDQYERIQASSAALGATTGFLAAVSDNEPLPVSKQFYTDVSGLAGTAVAGGILNWLPASNRKLAPVAFVNTMALSGLIGSRLVIPHLDLDTDDELLLISAPIWGAWFAPWTAYTLDPDAPPGRITGWTLMGAGAGWFAGLALGDQWQGEGDAVESADVLGMYGTLLGAGLPLALSDSAVNNSLQSGAMLAGGAAGLALGTAYAEQLQSPPPVQLLILDLTALGAFQGAGFAHYNHNAKRNTMGWGMVGAVAGGAAGLYVSKLTDVTLSLTSAVIAGEGLGIWFAVIGGDRFSLDGRDLLLASLIGGQAGLAGVVALTGPFDVAPERIAWAGVFGIGGAGVAATAVALATANRKSIETATLAGTAVGALAGAVIAPGVGTPKTAALETGWSLRGVQPYVTRMDGRVEPGVHVLVQLD